MFLHTNNEISDRKVREKNFSLKIASRIPKNKHYQWGKGKFWNYTILMKETEDD